jgi:hypothetical protein
VTGALFPNFYRFRLTPTPARGKFQASALLHVGALSDAGVERYQVMLKIGFGLNDD